MIEIKKLTKRYDEVVILENANYKLSNTGLVCLLGASGSGKTTIARMIAGIDNDYDGDIIVNGTSLKSLNNDELCDYRKNNIGFVFQDYNLLKGYTAFENILYPIALNNESKEESIEYANKLLAKLNITEKKDIKIENLSGGQKQRVAIARALIGNPNIILADEPTGALDRKTSKQIMEILKEISKTKLVFVITHDPHICEYADEVIEIENKEIVCEKELNLSKKDNNEKLNLKKSTKINYLELAIKNYKVSFLKYFFIAFVFSVGILALLLSLSSNRVIEKEIQKFKDKNTAFNNVYIKNSNETDQIFEYFKSDKRIENLYKQYKLQNISLMIDDKIEIMKEKYPMPKATEDLSYGIIPRTDKNEIAITPSLAKKFANNISELIGEKLTLKYNENTYTLIISGIYNAPYDDFFVSSDIERKFYKGLENKEYYSISFDVKDFENIVPISEKLLEKDIKVDTAKDEVKVIQRTFEGITRLFVIITLIILVICMFIISILLMKLKDTRTKMIKLLSAFGFNKKAISKMVALENILLIVNSILLTSIFVGIAYFFI